MHHSLRTIQTNNIGHNNVDSVVMPTLASATCLTASQRSPNKTTCWWWVASSVSILITLHKSQCQCQATRLVLARECSRAYKHARCTSEIAWSHLLHTRAFLFVRNGWSSKCLIIRCSSEWLLVFLLLSVVSISILIRVVVLFLHYCTTIYYVAS